MPLLPPAETQSSFVGLCRVARLVSRQNFSRVRLGFRRGDKHQFAVLLKVALFAAAENNRIDRAVILLCELASSAERCRLVVNGTQMRQLKLSEF